MISVQVQFENQEQKDEFLSEMKSAALGFADGNGYANSFNAFEFSGDTMFVLRKVAEVTEDETVEVSTEQVDTSNAPESGAPASTEAEETSVTSEGQTQEV